MPFTIRDFEAADFDALWRIDQDCFPPGISYSRTELKFYVHRRGSFTGEGVWLAGEIRSADPELCRWIQSGNTANERLLANRRFSILVEDGR